ncbi:MAG: RdgB/HAM1 family non-canonical purine NTP pyrophosphatase [Verrucomicrobiota bacterium]
MKIVCATGNSHKVDEFNMHFEQICPDLEVEVIGATVLGGMPEVDEDADSFPGNARLKADALWELARGIGAWVLSDDSGLAVDVLRGDPGVYSARYAGPGVSDSENVEKLLNELQGIPPNERSAKFVCSLCLIDPAGKRFTAEGYCHGAIALEPRGNAGFGYDPVFIPEGYQKTFGELGSLVKGELSHRAEALQDLVIQLRD